MEIELKYSVSSGKIAERIWKDEELKLIEEKNSRDMNEFRGTYYDTEDHLLFKNDIAFRFRKEGKKLVASLKWSGTNDGALHQREELNMNLGEGEIPKCPNPDVFKESSEGTDLLKLLDGKPLKHMMEVNVLRKSFRVDTGDSLVEISLDDGEIVTKEGNEPVCEMEIELFSGNQEDLVKLGERLRERYCLEPEKDSKFARGLKLLGMI